MHRTTLMFAVLTVAICSASGVAAIENFVIDSTQSYITIDPVIQLTDIGIDLPMTAQGDAGLGWGWYSNGFTTSIAGTLRTSLDVQGGSISFPGGSYIYAQNSGYWLPDYGGWYLWEYPANYGGYIDLANSELELEGTAVAAIRDFAIDAQSPGSFALSGGGGNYSFDSSLLFTNTSGAIDYYGISGLMTLIGSGRVYPFETTVGNAAPEATLSIQSGGFAQLTIPVQTTINFGLGELDIVGNAEVQMLLTGQLTAFQLIPGTYGNITDLGTLGGSYDESRAYGINESSQVVGYSYDEQNRMRAFIWENGAMHSLGAGTYFGSGTSRAWGINESGIATGDNNAGGDHAVNFENPGIHNLGGLTGPFGVASARDINDLGQVVGFANNAQGVRRAVLYENGDVVDLGQGEAWGINNQGQIVGSHVTGSIARPVLYENGDIIPLGTIEGPFGAGIAYDINEHGQIVGRSSTAQGTYRATLWDNGSIIDLGTLWNSPWASSEAHAINDHGLIVGNSDGTAVMWRNGQIVDLNTLLAPDAGWYLTDAWDVNNRNQIVGWGYRIAPNGYWMGQHAFLLQVPEPSTWLLGTVAVLGGVPLARRRIGTTRR